MRLVGPKNSRHRAVAVTLACLVALLVIGDVAPRAVLYFLHNGATELNFATRSVDPEGVVGAARGDSASGGSGSGDADSVGSDSDDERVRVETTARLSSQPARTDPADPQTKRKGSRIAAEHELRVAEDVLARLDDRVTLERSSGMPAVYPTSTLSLELPGAEYSQATGEFMREGVNYTFPPDTEKRSYPYFDPWLMDFAYLDYRGQAPADPAEPDMVAFVFGQRVPGHRLSETLEALGTPGDQAQAAVAVTGPARQWYSEEQLKRRGLHESDEVTMEPFYAVDREVKVEPQSGRIINITERIHVYLAQSTDPAEFADGSKATEAQHVDRTVLDPGGAQAIEQLAAARMVDPDAVDDSALVADQEYGEVNIDGHVGGDAAGTGRGDEVATGGAGTATADHRIRPTGPRTVLAAEMSWDSDTRSTQRDAARHVIDTRRVLAIVAWVSRALMIVVIVLGIRACLHRRPR